MLKIKGIANKEELKTVLRELLPELMAEGIVKTIKGGEHTYYLTNEMLHISASTPKIKLEGTEAFAKNLSIRENAGKIEVYNEATAAKTDDFDGACITSGSIVTAQLTSGCITSVKIIDDAITTSKVASGNITSVKIIELAVDYTKLDANTKRQRSVIRIVADGADADTWERAAFHAPVPINIVDAGIIPDTNFGRSGNEAVIAVIDKGITGTGTQSKVSKAFSTAVSGYVYTSLGTITSGYVASGEVITFKKTNNLSGQIVTASVLVLNIERGA